MSGARACPRIGAVLALAVIACLGGAPRALAAPADGQAVAVDQARATAWIESHRAEIVDFSLQVWPVVATGGMSIGQRGVDPRRSADPSRCAAPMRTRTCRGADDPVPPMTRA